MITQMITQVVLLGILISGSVLGSTVCKKRFEDLLPITCSSIVLILFLCGILGFLKQGVYLVLIISVFLWSYSLFHLFRNKSWKEFGNNFLTPAFCIFLAAYIVLTYINYGIMAATWDEFSHWADIVKAMVAIDDFGTNPEAQSIFQSYPPGMSLFQYFFEKVYLLLNRGELFSEWRLYFSYQIFFLSFLMPFLRKLTFDHLSVKHIFNMLIAAVLCCFGPMLIFHDIYIIILIDAFLGLIAGTGIAMIFVREEKDWSYDAYVLLNISMLVLAKDAGMLFAGFMLVTYLVDNVFYRKLEKRKQFLSLIFGGAALLLPKMLWSYNIKVNNADVAFSNKIDVIELFKVLFGIDRTSYRVEVVHNFFEGLFTRYFEASVLNIRVPYILLFLVLMAACYGMYRKYNVCDPAYKKERKPILILFMIETVVYVLGLCITYMFKFSEYEAVRLASFERYMHIMLQGLLVFLLMIVVNYLLSHHTSVIFKTCILCIIFAMLQWGMVKDVAKRTTVTNTVNTRVRYLPIIEKVEEITKETGQVYEIYIISQESAGYDGLILRYSLRPNKIVGSESIGKPFYDGDIWTAEKTAEEWQEELKSNADYVALYHLNDYFMEEFSEVFENAEDIHENGVYKVDKESGLLTLCAE